ncbi:MAG: hypothetical protein R3F11_09800 [Verrucomicrobiales bacterium]
MDSDGAAAAGEDAMLLPGIALDRVRPSPGYAALTFSAKAEDSGIPALELKSAFLETILFCKWGELWAAKRPVEAWVRR